MIINALNSGASVFMADFEDSNSPTWSNNIEGQQNLRDAIRGTIRFESPEGKQYQLGPKLATLVVRPRGWHLNEKHFLAGGKPISGSLFDFGLYFFHNAAALLSKGTGPYFYLPKMESHLEARLWNDVFCFAQDELKIPRGSIRATVLIETILAAFEMDEILYELRDHSAGLNCGRWDYIFSFIKKFRAHPEFVLPDRSLVTMEAHFLSSYVELLIQTCHRRGIHAMGGMAAQIPIRNDAAANEQAIEKVRRDKLREVKAGHDGTWVAHPGLVPVAKEIFDKYMPEANQISKPRTDRAVQAKDLIEVPKGEITEEGLRWNIDVGLQYLHSWLQGSGCVPIYNLMAVSYTHLDAQFGELLQDGQITDLVAGQVEVGGSEDEGLIALVTAIFDESRGLGVGSSHDDARDTHDVELEAGGVEALDLFVSGDEDLAALVAALLRSRLLIFDVVARHSDLDKAADEIADVRVSAVTGVSVGDDERPEVDGWRRVALFFGHSGAYEVLILVGGEKRAHQSGGLVGHLAERIAG